MNGWLLKTESAEYSYQDLQRAGRATWDGVRNAQALRNLRAMVAGDPVVIYHTGGERRAMGWARVIAEAYPDPTAGDPRWVVVDLEAGEAFSRPVPLSLLRGDPVFVESPLLRQGRLSVVPLTAEQLARFDVLSKP